MNYLKSLSLLLIASAVLAIPAQAKLTYIKPSPNAYADAGFFEVEAWENATALGYTLSQAGYSITYKKVQLPKKTEEDVFFLYTGTGKPMTTNQMHQLNNQPAYRAAHVYFTEITPIF